MEHLGYPGALFLPSIGCSLSPGGGGLIAPAGWLGSHSPRVTVLGIPCGQGSILHASGPEGPSLETLGGRQGTRCMVLWVGLLAVLGPSSLPHQTPNGPVPEALPPVPNPSLPTPVVLVANLGPMPLQPGPTQGLPAVCSGLSTTEA